MTVKLDPQGSLEAPPITKREGMLTAPLSRMQQRLAFIQQLHPGKPLYQIPTGFRLSGALDVDALERSLAEIVRRHDIIRTRISLDEGAAKQVVDPDLVIPLERVDLSTVPAADREQALIDWQHRLMNDPFDLAKGPLLRLALVRMGEDDHFFFFMPHHIIWDGASHDIFLRELDQLYDAFKAGKPSPLRPLPIQYGDFAAWHEKWLEGPALAEQSRFWKKQLEGELAPLELPTDRPRPARMTYGGGVLWWTLTKDEVAALTELGRKGSATLYMVLLAAFDVLLHRHTGQDDIRVGTPVRGRVWPKTNRIIGFFVNTLIVRTQVDPKEPFVDLLRRVNAACDETFRHGDMPLDTLVHELNVPRDMSRAPISQTFFAFRDVRDQTSRHLGLQAREVAMYSHFETQDLTLWATQTDDGMRGALTYNTDVFDAASMERLLERFCVLLRSIIADATVPVGQLALLTADERRLMQAWNDASARDYPRDRCVHQLFEMQARERPDAVAIRCDGATITYAALDARADRLANHLRGLGVGRDVPVGLCVERSIDMIVGQLGILKAGGAYVPLDPGYPKDRLAFMASDSRMPVIVTQQSLVDELPPHEAKIVRIDADWPSIAADTATPTSPPPDPASLAYVIYTSGSTGKPKGVLVPHGAATNLVCSTHHTPGLKAGDVVLAITTLSFDIAVFDTLGALSCGATIVLGDRELGADGDRLLQTIRERHVTMLNATPASWRLLVAAGWKGTDDLTAICTGEAMPRDLALELVARTPRVWNGYGPTETTVWSTFWRAQGDVERILIGKPVANTQLHILDAGMQPVPIGVRGELWIGGDGVTRGYLGRDDLTRERFIPDPFRTGVPGARLYRTGDVARFLDDGEVECLGRTDTQVKLRGFRIELGEIETALSTHEAVAQAVVMVREDRPGDPALVAYVRYAPSKSATATELRKHLRSTLPAYMIPQHFVEQAVFPLTPSGKIDRKKLPPPFAIETTVSDNHVAPRTDQEKLLAELCAQLLRVERVSASDNFFDIGGHSMLSLQLIALVQQKTGVRLSPRVLLVNSLAQIAATLPGSTPPAEVARPQPTTRSAPPPDTKDVPFAQRLFSRLKKIIEP